MNNNTLKKSKTVLLPNIVLTFAFIYFLFVVTEDEESFLRKTVYIVFTLLDLVVLVYINTDISIFKKASLFFKDLKDKYFGKKIKIEEPDDIKKLVEESVKKYDSNIHLRDNLAQPSFSNNKHERVILDSKTKFDDRLFSAKSFPYNFNYAYDERQIGRQIYPSQMPLDYSHMNQNYSQCLLKNLQLTQKFASKLKIGNEINKEDIERDAESIGLNENTDVWISNFKIFLMSDLIPEILNNHKENIDHLNKILQPANIQIVEEVVEHADSELRDEIAQLIKGNTLSFSSIRAGLNILKEYNLPLENKFAKSDEVMMKHKIFFGDSETIRFIIERIEEKLRMSLVKEKSRTHTKELEDFSRMNLPKTLFSTVKRNELISHNVAHQGVQTKTRDHQFNNPLLNKNKYDDKMGNYSDLLESHTASIEDNLKLLRNYLNNRLRLNELITPYLIKDMNYNHRQLILEYVIVELENLRKTNFENYKNDSGNQFKGEHWINALPTDSQIVASIFIKYLEDIFMENNITKPFLINYPLTPKIEKNSNSLTYYQINGSGLQPHFNVFFEDKMFNCIEGRENFFYASVVFLFLMKTKLMNTSRKMMIDDFLSMIISY